MGTLLPNPPPMSGEITRILCSGRPATMAYRVRCACGAWVVALDAGPDEVAQVRATLGAMMEAGEISAAHPATAVQGDALALPFADGTFDRVIASEVLEHIPDDTAAMRELAREVLRLTGSKSRLVEQPLPRGPLAGG